MTDIPTPPPRPIVPVENQPTTVSGSGDDKAPINAPQSFSADAPVTVNPNEGDEGNREQLSQSGDEFGDRKTLSKVAQAAANGEFGTGQDRRKNLKAAGWDFKEVEQEIIRLRNS